jgi:hypothetical protein
MKSHYHLGREEKLPCPYGFTACQCDGDVWAHRHARRRHRWTWRLDRYGWTHWGDTEHEVASNEPEGRTRWRRILFGLYRRVDDRTARQPEGKS